MAKMICKICGTKFHADYCCPVCQWEPIAHCWNCQSIMTPLHNDRCDKCGWFICNSCKSCGCSEERPMSKYESAKVRREIARFIYETTDQQCKELITRLRHWSEKGVTDEIEFTIKMLSIYGCSIPQDLIDKVK